MNDTDIAQRHKRESTMTYTNTAQTDKLAHYNLPIPSHCDGGSECHQTDENEGG